MKQNPGKVKTVMHEFKTGALKSSSGQKVTNPKQAIAIAMSEAGMKKPKKFAGKSGSYVGGSKRFEDLNKEMNRTGARYDLDDSSESTLKAIRDESMKDATKRQISPKKQSVETMRSRASRTVAPVVPGMKKGGEVGESKAMAKKEISFMQRKGAPKSMIKHEKEEYGMKRGGEVKKFAAGGNVKKMADGGETAGVSPRAMAAAVRPPMKPATPFSTLATPPPRPPMPMPRSDRANPIPLPQVRTGMGGTPPFGMPNAAQLADIRTRMMGSRAAVPPRSFDPAAAMAAGLGGIGMGASGLGGISQGLGGALTGYKKGGNVKKTSCMKKGGSIDGIAQRGKTKTQHFAKGGSVSSRADGIASKGKTNCKIC